MELSKIGFVISTLILVLAWLCFDHLLPWTTFVAQTLSIIAILILLLFISNQKLKVPTIVIPILVIATLPLIQYGFGLVIFLNDAVLYAGYITLFFLSIVASYNLNQKNEFDFFSMFLSAFIFAGVLSAIMAIMQWLNIEQHIPYVIHNSTGRAYANFAQPNNLATFLLMSLVATFALYASKKLHQIVFVLISLLLVIASVLTQSRMLFLVYPALILFLIIKGNKKIFFKQHLVLLFVSMTIFITLMIYASSIQNFLLDSTGLQAVRTATLESRMEGGSYRLLIWKQMITAILEQPWTGYGWGQVSLAQMDVLIKVPHFEVINSSHNLILDILVQNGIIIGGAIILYLFWFVIKIMQCDLTDKSYFALMMIVPFFVHSMFELPQNYAFFLLPVGMLIGFILFDIKSLKTLLLPKYILGMVALVGLYLVSIVWKDYINSIIEMRWTATKNAERWVEPKIKYDTSELYIPKNQIFILQQFSVTSKWNMQNPFTKVSKEQIKEYKAVVAIQPSGANLYKFAQLLRYNGYIKESDDVLKRVYILYNSKIDGNIILLKNGI